MKRIIVYRNKDCEKCRRFARVHDFFDWLNQVEGSTATPPGGPLAMGEIAVEVIETGEILKGVEAVRCICRHTPAYLPFLLLLRIPAIALRGESRHPGMRRRELCRSAAARTSRLRLPGCNHGRSDRGPRYRLHGRIRGDRFGDR